MNFQPGDEVWTPEGIGCVVFIRMKAPNYNTVSAVSVRLYKKMGNPSYSGTIFDASKVHPIQEENNETD